LKQREATPYIVLLMVDDRPAGHGAPMKGAEAGMRVCGWWDPLPAPPPARRLRTDEKCDAVVIGAGFTGLATARRLAERRPGWRVLLLESQRVGFGSSGRNSGFVGHLSHRDPDASARDMAGHERIARFGRDVLAQLVRQHDIQCDWSEVGRLHVAVEDHACRNLDRLVALLTDFDEPHEVLDAKALATAIGTSYYRTGVHVPGTALMQPAALVRGIAAALPSNVELFEESPVRSVHTGAPHRLELGEGSVAAAHLFICTNGLIPELGFLRRRIFPLFTYASLTRPLGESERQQLGQRSEWGLVSEDRMGSTMRRLRDGRLLIRNGVRYRPGSAPLDRIRRAHARAIAARYPALRDVPLDYTWGGVLGMTMNQGQFFGRLGDGVFASVGYNGTGVAMGTGSGMLLADFALGDDSPLVSDAISLRSPAWLPPEPFLGVGVRATTAYLQWAAGRER
jgi:glycine/D-amino acid oxidase-like deaminating enzyme